MNISGSRGLTRMARWRCSIAVSLSPIWSLAIPLPIQAAVEFGLSASARSMVLGAVFHVAGHHAERTSAEGEHGRIIFA